jgi:ATP-dependent exoDNAse (exonuclease V) alpha subunit
MSKDETEAWLRTVGLGERMAERVAEELPNAKEAITANPYSALMSIDGINFIRADKIARNYFNILLDDGRRQMALVTKLLDDQKALGHTFLPAYTLEKAMKKEGMTSTEPLQAALERGDVILDDNRVYTRRMFEAECGCAANLRLRAQASSVTAPNEIRLSLGPRPEEVNLDDDQLTAYFSAPYQNTMVITGGPGTGKTHTINSISALLESKHSRVGLCAPTGKAAKRLQELTGRKAQTIHRMLGATYGSWRYNATKPLTRYSVIICDESCMWWKTPVLMANGEWKPIGWIVNQFDQLWNPKVASWNPKTNRLEPREILNVFRFPRVKFNTTPGMRRKRLPNQEPPEPLLEIDASRSDSNRERRLIHCTKQHKIATKQGFVSAGELETGDKILVNGRFFGDWQRQIALGSLLGDAHLMGCTGTRVGSYQICFTQGNKQYDYLRFKMSFFGSLFTAEPHRGDSGYDGGDYVWNATMNLVDELDDIVPHIIRDGKKHPTRQFLNLLDERALTIWYLDDGYIHKASPNFDISLHTEGFDYETNAVLACWLQERFCVEAHIQEARGRYYLRLTRKGSRRFLDLVEKYIPFCMAYKARDETRACFTPVEEDWLNIGEAAIKSIQEWQPKTHDTHVFDLEVEGLNNYIAGNIVVHNSMLDIELTHHLLQAIPFTTHLIFVGDVDQLPPVGPGTPFKDMILSKKIPVVRLTINHRQGKGSTIAENAHRINRGAQEILIDTDFLFVDCSTHVHIREHLPEILVQLKSQGYDLIEEVQILSPQKTTQVGVEALNDFLRFHLNPDAKRWDKFSVGDKVMQAVNDYQLGIFNGYAGQIVADSGDSFVIKFFDEDTLIKYPKNKIEGLIPAYCCTVHKYQGSEVKAGIVIVSSSHSWMLTRNLLYTAITRFREKCIILGDLPALKRAISNTREYDRYSKLLERME